MKREVVDWKGRSLRRQANVVGTARREQGQSFRVLLVNISYEGCHILCEQALITGETLTRGAARQRRDGGAGALGRRRPRRPSLPVPETLVSSSAGPAWAYSSPQTGRTDGFG